MTRRVVTLLVVVGLAWGGLAAALAAGLGPRLGLDLRGGTSVILSAPEGTDPALVETAVDIMRRRIEDFGDVQEPEIAISGGTDVLVSLPGVTDQARALDAIGQTGELSFRPVLDAGPISPALIQQTLQQQSEEQEGAPPLPPGVDPETGLTLEDDPNLDVAYLPEYDDEGNLVAVYAVGPAALSGSDVANALALFGQSLGSGWTVQLNLTNEGADKFADITARLAAEPLGSPTRQLAIVLDGVVVAAPEVNSSVSPQTGITGGTAVITLGGDEQDAFDLATVLRYGSLPVAFERASVQKVSATLGEDALVAGLIAGLAGLLLVVLYILFYYRALGLVPLLGLTVFGSLLILAFSVLGQVQGLTLTLSGVAGVIVSVGITADSYIVYFERLKEEARAGRTIVDASDEAFRHAFRTILTADFVSFMGATLLWALSVGAVKGFALALGIATLLDVFVAYYFTRNFVAILVRTRLAEGGRFSVRAATGLQEVTA